jgi:polysaccharide export outer membrane protein
MFASTVSRICSALLMCAFSSWGAQQPTRSITRDTVDYRIGPRDVIQIDVWQESEISRTTRVRPDGKVSLPLLGDVQAAGLTPMQLADVIRKELMTHLTTPQVTVTVTVREFGTKRLADPASKSAPHSVPSPDIKPKCCVA